ncbi:MAG: acyl-CoA dehydrogenase family protein [Burkholderiaceae bacterium]|nr:acyl-CoA dehydrogenase family protein [Burkholderiaceae bacterium]
MDFEFNDDQAALREAVSRWVEKGYDFERRRAITKAGGFSRDAWGELAELGLLGLAWPEASGGMGFGAVEAMVVMEELGRGMVVEPYAAVALVAAPLLAASTAPEAAKLAQGVADGSAIVVLAHQERGARYDLAKVETRAERDASGAWRISGAKSIVPAGEQADAFIVPARVSGSKDDPQGIALFLVERGASVTLRGYPTQDGACAAELTLAQSPAIELIAAGQGFDALEAAIDRGIAAVAAEAVGVMDKFVALTVEYMNTRKQFGVAIGTFQALRHRIADVKIQLELARSMSYFASLKLGEPPAARRRALSQAKVQLGHSMRFVGQQCIQLHGGIGMTDEYVGSHCFKRLTMIELAYGDTLHHLGEVSARLQDTAGVFA